LSCNKRKQLAALTDGKITGAEQACADGFAAE